MPVESSVDEAENTLAALNVEVLHKARFPEQDKRLLDYIVRKGNDITLVKFAKKILTSSSIFKELKRLLNFLKINALLVADKINNENVIDGVLHIRGRVGIVQLKTLYDAVRGNGVYVYEFKGMYYVRIDGEKLRKLRLGKGYGLSELARSVGTSVKALQKYEEELIDMSIEKAYRFIELFGDEFEQVLKEVDIFRDRIDESSHQRYVLSAKESEEYRCKLLRKFIAQGVEAESFSHFPSDIILRKEGVRMFISLIDNKMDLEKATLKASENKRVSQILNGIPINVVSEGTPKAIVRELEDYGEVYRCEDLEIYGQHLG